MDLKFGDRIWKPDVRLLSQMHGVLFDAEWMKTTGDFNVYHMYRDLGLTDEDRIKIQNAGLRYDITVIGEKTLGAEYPKTMGHYHPKAEGANVSYPELYQVLSGEAHFLLQRVYEDIIADAILIKAKKLDCVIIPPDYGHVTINPGPDRLKMANWVCRDFASVYEPYLEKGGACYFEMNNRDLVANEKYGKLPALRVIDAKDTDFDLIDGDMYNLISELPKLDFLKKPQSYKYRFKY